MVEKRLLRLTQTQPRNDGFIAVEMMRYISAPCYPAWQIFAEISIEIPAITYSTSQPKAIYSPDFSSGLHIAAIRISIA